MTQAEGMQERFATVSQKEYTRLWKHFSSIWRPCFFMDILWQLLYLMPKLVSMVTLGMSSGTRDGVKGVKEGSLWAWQIPTQTSWHCLLLSYILLLFCLSLITISYLIRVTLLKDLNGSLMFWKIKRTNMQLGWPLLKVIYGSESTSLNFITLIKRQNGNKLLSSLALYTKTQIHFLANCSRQAIDRMSALYFSEVSKHDF